jgi:HK97 family phage prohead protease
MQGENGEQYIEGYFAVFNSDYQIAPDMSESIAPGAFDNTLSDDVRCLTDHDTRLVLGRTSAHTFEIRQDEHGLWGRALVNPNDQDALNTKARVDRGDVNQASFGFDIVKEDTEIREDGSVHWTIREVKLYECSVVTFPAYQETNISARSAQKEEILKRGNDAWKEKAKTKLKGE